AIPHAPFHLDCHVAYAAGRDAALERLYGADRRGFGKAVGIHSASTCLRWVGPTFRRAREPQGDAREPAAPDRCGEPKAHRPRLRTVAVRVCLGSRNGRSSCETRWAPLAGRENSMKL